MMTVVAVVSALARVILKTVIDTKLKDTPDLLKELFSEGTDQLTAWGESKLGSRQTELEKELRKVLEQPQFESLAEHLGAEIKALINSTTVPLELYNSEERLAAYLYNEYLNRPSHSEHVEDIRKILLSIAPVIIKVRWSSDTFLPEITTAIYALQRETNHTVKSIDGNVQELKAASCRLEGKLDAALHSEPQEIVADRTAEYCSKWMEPMFLNDYEEDEDGVRILQCELYRLPHYLWKEETEGKSDLEDFLLHKSRKALLVFGHPGIGKSTLITWFLNHYKGKRRVLVYRFSDFPVKKWLEQGTNQFRNMILNSLGLTKQQLENTILFLDGFDEIGMDSESRIECLNQLYQSWKGIQNFSWIATCRVNYIAEEKLTGLAFPYITLQPWDETQIKAFADTFQRAAKTEVSKETLEHAQSDKEVFGIPLILYMVLALGIQMKTEGSLVEVYDRIFQLDGGIYDRCINWKNYDPALQSQPFVKEKKKQIHQMSREIAFWMFENNDEVAAIPRANYREIEEKIGTMDTAHLISSYFERVHHSEGMHTEELRFVHRTIYEYFVVENFYAQTKALEEAELAKQIVCYLKAGYITTTISEYLTKKLELEYKGLNTPQRRERYLQWEGAAVRILVQGVCYCDAGINCENVHQEREIEARCFQNLCKLLRGVKKACEYPARIFSEQEGVSKILSGAIKHTVAENIGINCSGFCLSHINLWNAHLINADLRGADLSGADLSNADLRGADLSGADLRDADLTDAELNDLLLRYEDLRDPNVKYIEIWTNLDGAYLSQNQLANLQCSKLKRAAFDFVFVDQKAYTRSEFFETFYPDENQK